MATQGDLATSKLTYLASQNKFGNIKASTPGVSEPTVDPTTPVAEQEAVAESAPTTSEPVISDDVTKIMNGRIQDMTNTNIANAATKTRKMNNEAKRMSIFDWAKMAQNEKEFTL